MSYRVLTVVGARPQFVKAVPVSRALERAGVEETLVDTGQHYDWAMSDVFFERLNLRAPAYQLGVGSASQAVQTARVLERLEPVVQRVSPDMVLVYGDTNSTVAAALCTAKLDIPIAHVEAGLRDFDRSAPEEVNRVVTDHLSTILFAPTGQAIENLRREGIGKGVIRTGDVMYDTAMLFRSEVESLAGSVPARFGLVPGEYAFVTVHRAENTNDEGRWSGIIEGIRRIARDVAPVLWPAHPRTKQLVAGLDLPMVTLVEPLPYFETQSLLLNARLVVTDSGGLQKEAAFYSVPCVTLREKTPWVETVAAGLNVCAGIGPDDILDAARAAKWPSSGLPAGLFGDGRAAEAVALGIVEYLTLKRIAGQSSERFLPESSWPGPALLDREG